MDMTRFQELVAAYGGDVRRWPAAERETAQEFAGREPAAARLLADAADLDRLLDAGAAAVPPADLAARIVASLPTDGPVGQQAAHVDGAVRPAMLRQGVGWVARLRGVLDGLPRPAAAVMGGAAFAGLIVGFILPGLVLDTAYTDENELMSLVLGDDLSTLAVPWAEGDGG